jgi:hypothetical protein
MHLRAIDGKTMGWAGRFHEGLALWTNCGGSDTAPPRDGPPLQFEHRQVVREHDPTRIKFEESRQPLRRR